MPVPKLLGDSKTEDDDQDKELFHVFKCTLVLQWDGNSLVDLANNPELAVCSVPDEEIYYHGMDHSVASLVRKENLLESALLVNVSIRKVKSTFPCNLAVDIVDIAEKKYTLSNGDHADYVVFDMETNYDIDEVVCNKEESLTSAYISKNRQYMPHRFDHGIMAHQDVPYVFVPIGHPMIELINQFEAQSQMKLTDKDIVNNRFYKIDKDFVNKVESAMIPKLESMFPQRNLKEFKVKIRRADGLSFDDASGILDNVHTADVQAKMMNAKRNLSIILEISYACIPSMPSSHTF